MYWYEKILNGKTVIENNSFKLGDHKYFKWLEDQAADRGYKLICDNKTIGSLVFNGASKRLAAGKIYRAEFLIKKHWLFTSRITINHKEDVNKSFMFITSFNRNGMLNLRKNEKILWTRLKHLENEWAFTRGNNQKIIVFKPVTTNYKSGYLAEIKDKYINEDTTAILLLTGIFNLVTMNEEIGIASVFI